MAVTTELKLGFITRNNKTVSITVNDPALGLNRGNIQDAMDDMIAADIISKTSGLIDNHKYAKLVTTDITDITLP